MEILGSHVKGTLTVTLNESVLIFMRMSKIFKYRIQKRKSVRELLLNQGEGGQEGWLNLEEGGEEEQERGKYRTE